MACGRRVQPRRCTPSAMAPLETSTQRLPRARSCAICAAQRAIAAASRPRPWLVTSEDPTLTTSVAAPATRLGCTAAFLFFVLEEELIRLRRQFPAALAADGRDLEPAAFPAQRAHDLARARFRFPGVRQHVDLVEHQPARFFVERG